MVFGESKPEGELRVVKKVEDAAIFPLATPSIADPGDHYGSRSFDREWSAFRSGTSFYCINHDCCRFLHI